MSEFDVLRDDQAVILLNDEAADRIASRLVHRFHAAQQKHKGGVVTSDGQLIANPVTQNQWGGKSIIKFNPSDSEVQSGIRQEVSLLGWQSPDGLPHYVTIEVGRLSGGVGGPGADNATPGAAAVSNGVGGGTFPLGRDTAGNALSYRATAQILIGTPGTMQDPFFIDLNRGQRFTALASYVVVTAAMGAPPSVPDVPTGNPFLSGSMGVYATLGAAVAPSLAPVLYTQYEDANTPAATHSFSRIIPPRANFLLPVYSSLSASAVRMTFRNNAGEAIFRTPLYDYNVVGAMTPTLEIPEDAYTLEVVATNVVVIGNAFWRMVYQLSV